MRKKTPHRFRVEAHRRDGTQWYGQPRAHYGYYNNALRRAMGLAVMADCFDEVKVLLRIGKQYHVVRLFSDLEIRRLTKEEEKSQKEEIERLERAVRELEKESHRERLRAI